MLLAAKMFKLAEKKEIIIKNDKKLVAAIDKSTFLNYSFIKHKAAAIEKGRKNEDTFTAFNKCKYESDKGDPTANYR